MIINCQACGRHIDGKPKEVKVQYKTWGAGTNYQIHYYRRCYICKRCWHLRIASIFVGIVCGILFFFPFMYICEHASNFWYVLLLLMFNPLSVGGLGGMLFRLITKCSVDLDEKGNLKKDDV